MQGEKKKMLHTYSLLRVIACFSVIWHHALRSLYGSFPENDRVILEVVDNLLMCNNCLFFMLSGRFALQKEVDSYKKFYRHKIVKIVLPFTIASMFYYIAAFHETMSLKDFFYKFMGNGIQEYLWFVYVLIGFYLLVPFWQKMFAAMDERHKKLFWALLLGFVLVQNICKIYHLPLPVNNFLFSDYLVYCFLGYLVDNMELFTRGKKWFYGLGILAVAISTYETIFALQWNPYIYSFSLSRIFMCIAFYLLITKETAGFCDRVQKWLKPLNDSAYYIYLSHGFFQTICLNLLAPVALRAGSPISLHLLVVLDAILIFILSYIFAKCVCIFPHFLQILTARR